MADQILTFIGGLFAAVVMLDVLILLPLLIFRSSRRGSANLILISSYVLGAALWVVGAMTAYHYWGMVGLLIGLFIVGIGVVPVAILASAFNGGWSDFWALILLMAAVFVGRFFAMWILSREENANVQTTPSQHYDHDGEVVGEKRNWHDVKD